MEKKAYYLNKAEKYKDKAEEKYKKCSALIVKRQIKNIQKCKRDIDRCVVKIRKKCGGENTPL